MRTTPSSIAAQLAAREATLANCLWIQTRDFVQYGMTDHDRDLVVDMTDVSDMPVTYSAHTGIFPSDVTLATGLDADNFEVRGPIGSTFTLADILGRRFNMADVRYFKANWSESWPSLTPMMAGYIAETRIEGDRFVFEVRSQSGRYKNRIGEAMSPYCTADFGDARCKFVPTDIPATVTAASSALSFTLNIGGVYIDDYFNLGRIDFVTGALAGSDALEVFDYFGTTSDVLMFTPWASAPQIGDTLMIRRGCSKLKSSTDPLIPTCATYGNVLNFRGADQVPGSDTYLKMAVPGAAGA